MKRNTLIATVLLFSSFNMIKADYLLKWPIEGIIFKNFENEENDNDKWVLTDPVFSSWVNQGDIYECINWIPNTETKYIDETFNQSSDECKQNQTRTKQNREVNTSSGEVRNKGTIVTENTFITVGSTREIKGTSNSWDSFADYKNISKDWSNLNWGGLNLTSLPTDNYPVATVTGNLYFNGNKLKNLDSLISLTSVNGYFGLYEGTFVNLNGLINLRTVGQTLSIRNNPSLNNMSGLANVVVGGVINIDKTYSGPKMPANSRFCQLNATTKFSTGYATKSQLCL